MIDSEDAAETWTEISGLGQTDFHAIQPSGEAIVAGVFQAAAASVSTDGGKTFEDRRTPIPRRPRGRPQHARLPDRIYAAVVIRSADGGRSSRERDRIPNVRFTWPGPDALYRIDPGESLKFSADGGGFQGGSRGHGR